MSSRFNQIDDDVLLLQGAQLLLLDEHKHEYVGPLLRVPCRTSTFRGRDWVEELIHGHSARLMENCRIIVDNFMRLCQILVMNGYVQQNAHKHVQIEEALAMTLVMLSHNVRFRCLAERFQGSSETMLRNVYEIIEGLCMFGKTIIRPRTNDDVHSRILHDPRFYPWFKDAIGAMDGTHIPAYVSKDQQMAFTNRHGVQSQNVLAVCDHDMRFVFVYAGWEGSAHDARVIEHAMNGPTEFPMPPLGKYYLVDSAFRMVPGFLAPYKGRTVQHNSCGRGRANTAVELFNRRHSTLRNIIERNFGVLKRRFAFLRGPVPNFFMTNQVNVVITCCALHNYLIESQPDDIVFFYNQLQDAEPEDHQARMLPYNVLPNWRVTPDEIHRWKAIRDQIANAMFASS